MGTSALGSADNSPQVMGVGNFVADHQQRRLAPLRRFLQNILHRGVGLGGGDGNNALVAVGDAHGIQLPPVRLHHYHAGLSGGSGNAAKGTVRLPFSNIEFINRRAGAQGLRHRVAALDESFGLRPDFMFFHIPTPISWQG